MRRTSTLPPISKGRNIARNYMSLALSPSLNKHFTALLREYGGPEAEACLQRREAVGRTWWLIGDVIAWAVDQRLRRLPPFRTATPAQRAEILDVASFLETVMELTGAYDGFNTMPFPSNLNWGNLGECILDQDLCSVRSAQLYGPRTQRLIVLAEHPTADSRRLAGCMSLFFEKINSGEPDCQYVVLIDKAVLVKEYAAMPGTPGVDFASPSEEVLSQRVLAAQCGIHFQYFKDRKHSHETTPDPVDNLSSLNVEIQTVFNTQAEQPALGALNVLVIVGSDPTRTQAVVSVFKTKLLECMAVQGHSAGVCFSFLQTGMPGMDPGLFECCRDDGQFCSWLLQELTEVSPAVVEVLRPSCMQGASLSQFLDKHLPAEGVPSDPIGDYRQVHRGLCVPTGQARPCAPCQASRLCGGPKGCMVQ